MHSEKIIEWQVVDTLREIEHAGTHDMYDRPRVIAHVHDLGMYQAAAWLRANRHLYFQMLARARALADVKKPQELFGTGERALAALCR